MNSLRKNIQILRINFKEKKLTRERYKNNSAKKKKGLLVERWQGRSCRMGRGKLEVFRYLNTKGDC